VLHYIESDHLGTPRVVVDATRNVSIWRLNQTDDPFGRSAPNTNPDSDGTSFAFNLRFAGQYHDAETGWHYNVHRYYDPTTGRYLESDPIGLNGGISTYSYVGAAPLTATDPLGLWIIKFSYYAGYGGEFYFGKDPVTGGFLGFKGGVGVGAGVGWSPTDNRPGADPCQVGGASLGLFGEAGGSFGPLEAAFTAQGGGVLDYRQPLAGYFQVEPEASATSSFSGLRGVAAAGAEFVIYGNAAAWTNEGCKCAQ